MDMEDMLLKDLCCLVTLLSMHYHMTSVVKKHSTNLHFGYCLPQEVVFLW